MKIDYLCNIPWFLEIYVDEIWRLWSDDFVMLTPYKSKDDLMKFVGGLSTDIPCVYVLHDDKEFVGGCLIDKEDMGMHPWLSPWFANVVVLPQHQKKGLGTKLLKHVVKRYDTLYLWTFNERLAKFYRRFGFVTIDTVKNHCSHENLIVMKRVEENKDGDRSCSDITQS